MGFFEEYKPFRNYMGHFDFESSLVDLWRYSMHIVEARPLPADYAVGFSPLLRGPLKTHFWPWDLDILAKEIVLNAGTAGDKSLKRWSDLAAAINHLRRLDDAAFSRGSAEPIDIMYELHRIAHRQFPWQIRMGMAPMMRAFKVFGEKGVAKIVQRELGMTTRQFMLLGMAVRGHFQKQWGMSTDQDYRVLGISKDASTGFFRRISAPRDVLREATKKTQSYDRDWLYSWNPMEATPLVGIDRAHPDRVVCPIPLYLARRTSSGLFYDLVRASGFDNPFGTSFQTYIGDVIAATCRRPRFRVLVEERYGPGAMRKDGVDWGLSDATGHLFIETKTKRLTIDAKTHSDAAALDRDLGILAEAVVQNYRNVQDALDGKTRWQPDGLPVYPLVLTLEDWFIFSPGIDEMLDAHVRRGLGERGLSAGVLEQFPYGIGSAHAFEIGSQIIAQVGIAPYISQRLAKRMIPRFHRWSLMAFDDREFAEELKHVNWHLFADEWDQLMPDVPRENET